MAFFKKSKSLNMSMTSLVGEEVVTQAEYNFDRNQDEYVASDNLNFSRQENFSDIQDEPQIDSIHYWGHPSPRATPLRAEHEPTWEN